MVVTTNFTFKNNSNNVLRANMYIRDPAPVAEALTELAAKLEDGQTWPGEGKTAHRETEAWRTIQCTKYQVNNVFF